MACPRCGSESREGAAYCDACGEPLAGGAPRTVSPPDGLMGLMALDWTLRSVLAGVLGIIGAILVAATGNWQYVPLFLAISAVGWGILIFIYLNAS